MYTVIYFAKGQIQTHYCVDSDIQRLRLSKIDPIDIAAGGNCLIKHFFGDKWKQS